MSQPEDRLTVACYPVFESENTYLSRIRDILSTRYAVVALSSKLRLLVNVLARRQSRYDAIIVNWLEGRLVGRTGYPSIVGALRVLLTLLLFRICARRTIYVRHNNFPHVTRPAFTAFVKMLTDLMERVVDVTLTHSGAALRPGRLYCPHPLYEIEDHSTVDIPEALQPGGEYFVIFGRIEPHKKIERMMAIFPGDRKLLVFGACNKDEYARQLRDAATDNVTVVPGRVSEGVAQQVITRSAGLIVGHADTSMIVSGSFFYALSLGTPIYALKTDFIRWIETEVEPPYLQSAGTFPEFVELMRNARPAVGVTLDAGRWQAAFGDAAVRSAFDRAIRSPRLPG